MNTYAASQRHPSPAECGHNGRRNSRLAKRLASLTIALALGAPVLGFAGDFSANDARQDLATAMPDEAIALKPGEFAWNPDRAAPGQLVIVVSLPEQRAHVYRNGIRIGVSTVSTGTPDHPTPTGTFEILQKKEMNYSNLYNNAPMPFMQRLTWDGIALHAGKIPGYPASHGCVRLPLKFAETLYRETEKGILVVIADETSHGPEVAYPGAMSPVDAYSGQSLAPDDGFARGIVSAAP